MRERISIEGKLILISFIILNHRISLHIFINNTNHTFHFISIMSIKNVALIGAAGQLGATVLERVQVCYTSALTSSQFMQL